MLKVNKPLTLSLDLDGSSAGITFADKFWNTHKGASVYTVSNAVASFYSSKFSGLQLDSDGYFGGVPNAFDEKKDRYDLDICVTTSGVTSDPCARLQVDFIHGWYGSDPVGPSSGTALYVVAALCVCGALLALCYKFREYRWFVI
jgi:hypothetical protein